MLKKIKLKKNYQLMEISAISTLFEYETNEDWHLVSIIYIYFLFYVHCKKFS